MKLNKIDPGMLLIGILMLCFGIPTFYQEQASIRGVVIISGAHAKIAGLVSIAFSLVILFFCTRR